MVAGCGQCDKKLSADPILVLPIYISPNFTRGKETETNQWTRSNKTNVESATEVKKKTLARKRPMNERTRSNKTNVESATEVKKKPVSLDELGWNLMSRKKL